MLLVVRGSNWLVVFSRLILAHLAGLSLKWPCTNQPFCYSAISPNSKPSTAGRFLEAEFPEFGIPMHIIPGLKDATFAIARSRGWQERQLFRRGARGCNSSGVNGQTPGLGE
ncbi:hypothetical protein XELAEV_18013290mg [Xenopus laevis]|uniref:Secreted protein n=1 Tax=Xenopus laevis TaxID=8355 RepID=A0A974DPL8_XENLA|nr:hypothetical protein XELAEV_18013290mg [Xenopus laevis]